MRKRRDNRTGWLDQQRSGRWRARFEGPDGVRRAAPQTFDTKQDATRWLEGQARQVRAGTWTPPRTTEEQEAAEAAESFRGYAAAWLAERNLKPRTHADYRAGLDRHILPVFGPVPLADITPTSVRAWYAALLPDRPTARSHAYGLLRTILGDAVRDERIPANPCTIRGAGNVRRASRTELPSPVQVAALAEAMGTTRSNDGSLRVLSGGKYRVMTLLAAWCGLRFGELTELRRGDLVLEDGLPAVLRVRRGVVHVQGEFIVGPPKSEAGIRDMVIPTALRAEVGAYVRTLPATPDALLFPGSRGGHMPASGLYRVFYRARGDVGVPALRWHDLRHFAATNAARTGASLAEIQRFAGHSTVAAAMKYQHAAEESARDIAAGFDRLMATGSAIGADRRA